MTWQPWAAWRGPDSVPQINRARIRLHGGDLDSMAELLAPVASEAAQLGYVDLAPEIDMLWAAYWAARGDSERAQRHSAAAHKRLRRRWEFRYDRNRGGSTANHLHPRRVESC
ncbi:MAG: hypothetical protein IPK16_29880 [Anaerolineales bacterium]|nr:hypothetical protein [Anaerolineales bacterium]